MNEQWQDNTNDEAKRALAEWSHAVADETEAELQAIMSPEEYAWYRHETAASIHDTTNTAETYAALKAQQGEALAAEYGDGYEAGVKDGIRDLCGAIKLAIAQADISQRLPTAERVLAEFEAMYLIEPK